MGNLWFYCVPVLTQSSGNSLYEESPGNPKDSTPKDTHTTKHRNKHIFPCFPLSPSWTLWPTGYHLLLLVSHLQRMDFREQPSPSLSTCVI